MQEALLFDYGGTLDTCGVHWFAVLRQAWSTVGLLPDDAMARAAYVFAEHRLSEPGQVGTADTFRDVLEKKLRLEITHLCEHGSELSESARPDAVAERLADRLDAQVRRNVHEVRRLLTRLRKRFRLVLVSNFYGNLCAVLDDYGLFGLFDAVVESAAVGVRKPDPAIWRLGVRRAFPECDTTPDAALATRCTAIGDSLKNDILPAVAVGCRTIWLNPATATTPNEWPAQDATIQPTNAKTARNYEELGRLCGM